MMCRCGTEFNKGDLMKHIKSHQHRNYLDRTKSILKMTEVGTKYDKNLKTFTNRYSQKYIRNYHDGVTTEWSNPKFMDK